MYKYKIGPVYIGLEHLNQNNLSSQMELFHVNTQYLDRIYTIYYVNKIKKTYNHENRKQPIEMSFYGEENNYAYLTLSYENIKVQKKSSIKFEKALTTPLTQERIVQQLSKDATKIIKKS